MLDIKNEVYQAILVARTPYIHIYTFYVKCGINSQLRYMIYL